MGTLTVDADPDRLSRVIGHLVQNACEATSADGEVWVSASADARSVLVEVSDDGCGMSREFIETELFRPFTSTKSTGLGVGTFECREYIESLGGSIEVDSNLAAGTTFRVRLPLTGVH